MDGNNWLPTQGQVQIPGQVVGVESVEVAAAGMGGGEWRSQLQPDSRQRIVNKIMETLKKHLPFSGEEGLHELKKIAVRFEEKIYAGATSQEDYLRKISLKMLTMENKSQNSTASSLQSNPANSSKNPQDPVTSQSMQSQTQNQVQQLPIPSQGRQQVLSQNISNNIASTGVPNSSGLTSTLPAVSGMSSVPGHNSNIQNIQSMPNVNPNVGNSMGQGLSSNVYANSQRQVQGMQHVGSQDQQPQPQNSQYIYNQQLQHHLMKQTFQHGGIPQSIMQSQIQQQQQKQQQQNLLQQNQIHPSQQAVMQTSLRQTSASSNLQNQQSTQSRLQQQPLSVLRQQQTSMGQNQILGTQQSQQQQVSGQQPNTGNMQQNQLTGQQNNIIDEQQHQQQQQMIISQQNNISNMQQQQAIGQQNNIANMHQQQSTGQLNSIQNMHQQQLAPQNSLSGFQQQQVVGVQHGNSSLTTTTPVHMIQQSNAAVSQQMQQNMVNMLPNQVQQSHSMQQQLRSQIQPQPGQLQQQLGLQQKGASLQRDMQQRISTSSSLLQQQTTIDQQKQLMQSERASELPPTSSDFSSHTGNVSSGDWQEETYQAIKNMNEMYFLELNEIFQRMSAKVQQLSTLPQPKTDQLQLDKIKRFTTMLDHFVRFLQLKKNGIQLHHKEKLGLYHKQIVGILNSNRPRKPAALLQQQLAQHHTHAAQQSTQQLAQISQIHMNDGQMNSQMQQMNAQSSIVSPQQNTLANLQHNSLSGGVSNSRQSMMDALQPGLNIDPGQGNTFNQMQQGKIGSMQQNSVSSPQQMGINSMSSQSGITTLQSNINSLQANQIKQEQQVFSTQQIKQQYQQRQMQHQLMQRQQLLQQQLQTTQQQSLKISTQPNMQHNQMNDTNDIKIRHQMGVKPGVLQAHGISGQRYQQLKPGIPFSTAPQQVLQASSPQIGQHPSPQFDLQNLPTSHSKAGTPLQSANSPYIVPSPSTSLAPSPMPGDNEKLNHGVSLSNAVHQSTTAASVSNQSLAIGTPGISASPLLAEFTSPVGTHGLSSTIVSGNSNIVGQPLERLTKVVKSMSSKALSASISDITSVINMVDRISGSAPGNGSRAAVGEDLVAMTKCRLQARNFFTLDGPAGIKRMRRYTHAMPSNVVSSTGSVIDDFRHLNGNESDGESTGASSIKRSRIEVTHALEEELKEINQRLVDTVVHISEEDVDPTAIVTSTECGEGTIVKCSFSAVALSPNLKSQYASAQMSPIQPLRLLIPRNYPNSSPILLDKFPAEVSKEFEDLSGKTRSRFSISLRTLKEPISLMDIARTWDTCARAVISEYFEQCGGGSFSSQYGIWENCLTAV